MASDEQMQRLERFRAAKRLERFRRAQQPPLQRFFGDIGQGIREIPSAVQRGLAGASLFQPQAPAEVAPLETAEERGFTNLSPDLGQGSVGPRGPIPTTPSDYPEPQTMGGKVVEALARYSPEIAAGAAIAPVLAGTGTIAGPVLAELGAATAGLTAAEKVRARGGGAVTQTAADVLTAAAMPVGAAVGAPARISGRLAREAPDAAAEVATEIAGRLSRRGITNAAGGPLGPEDVYDAAYAILRDLPPVPDVKAKAIERLERALQIFPEEGARPSLAQSLEELGGYNLTARELRAAKYDPQYAGAAYARRLQAMEGAEAEALRLRPVGGSQAGREALESAIEAGENSVRQAWDTVEAGSGAMPNVSTAALKAEGQRLIDEGLSMRYMPPELRYIMQLPDEVPALRMQNILSELKATRRAGQRPMATGRELRQGGRAVPLIRTGEEALDAALDPAQYADIIEARRRTMMQRTEFDPRRPAVKAILTKDEPLEWLKAVRRADSPISEARDVRRWLGDDGMSGLRAAIWDEVIGTDLGDRSVRAMRNRIKTNRRLYSELLEPEQFEVLERAVDKWAMATSGKTGTAAQAVSTATGYDLLDTLMDYSSGGGWARTRDAMSLMRAGFHRITSDSPAALALARLATQDIEVARTLLEVPTPENLTAMRTIWNAAVEAADRRLWGLERTAGQQAIRPATQEDIERLQAQR